MKALTRTSNQIAHIEVEDQADTGAEDLKVRDLDRQERHLAPQRKGHNHPLNFKISNSLFLIGL